MKALIHILAEMFTVVSFIFTVIALLSTSFLSSVAGVLLISLGLVVSVLTDHNHNSSWYTNRYD